MRIILLGPPGCGKGTQGELVAKEYHMPRIVAGDILRQAVQKGTPLGKKAEAFMNQGKLVRDDLVIDMIKERIEKSDCGAGYILDGFPRNIHQAKALEEIDPGRRELVIDIRIDEEELVERLSARRICADCGTIYNLLINPPKRAGICDVCGGQLKQRDDDKPEVIKERLRVYHLQTEKLIDYYYKKGVLREIDGQGEIKQVFQKIKAILDREGALTRKDEAVR
ncbi:MAG: adenylate kinase [Candidatus Aminicenantales bacterium]